MHSELFALSSSLETFEAVQNFISKVKAQYDYWHFHQTKQTEICPEQLFLTNLGDLLHWIKNTKQGCLRRHLQFHSKDLPQSTQFFIFGHNLIQVCKLNPSEGGPQNKFVVHVRNASFNSETFLQITNPQHNPLQLTHERNKQLMEEMLSGQTKARPLPTENEAEIDQAILLQAIDPIVVNTMKRSKAISRVHPDKLAQCASICELLDQIPPYNVNFIFVCSYFSDKQTSLDVLSRLGNFTCMEGYDHYLIDLDP